MNKKIIISIVVVVVVVLIGWAILAAGNHGNVPQAQTQAQPAQAGTNNPAPAGQPVVGSYTSSADGFSVNFTETPQVTKTTFTSPTAGTIPLTKYVVTSGSGASEQYYAIDVYHYPQTYQFPSGYLTGALGIFAIAVNAKYPGAKLTSSQTTQLLGNPAIQGTFTVTTSGQQSQDYVTITTKGQNTYGIGTYGVSQSDYNAFVNSFMFAQ
jgi:VCBS repeat-containing protein